MSNLVVQPITRPPTASHNTPFPLGTYCRSIPADVTPASSHRTRASGLSCGLPRLTRPLRVSPGYGVRVVGERAPSWSWAHGPAHSCRSALAPTDNHKHVYKHRWKPHVSCHFCARHQHARQPLRRVQAAGVLMSFEECLYHIGRAYASALRVDKGGPDEFRVHVSWSTVMPT